jgi:cytochrome c peroxidase
MKQFFLILILLSTTGTFADDLDLKMSVIKELYQLSPKECNDIRFKDASNEEIQLGKLLFESKVLSGNDEIACINCHLDEFSITDGLPLAIGVNGIGEGMDRMSHGMGVIVPRNAISLIGVGHKSFSQFFWDGKVSAGSDGNIYSQLGTKMSNTFSNALAVAAVMPLLERDELIGSNRKNNEISKAVDEKLYNDKFNAVSEVIVKKFGNNGPGTKEINELALSMGIQKIDLKIIGEHLATFIANEFKCSESLFDRYLAGDSNLTDTQKRGAITFYGEGRCATCHSGNFFRNNSFHSIGVYQGKFGPHSRHRDIGRAGVTFRLEDLYKFRTPTLVNIKNTSPYGHNGSFETLEDVVIQHFNPVYIFSEEERKNKFLDAGAALGSRDKILGAIRISNEGVLKDLINFLEIL